MSRPTTDDLRRTHAADFPTRRSASLLCTEEAAHYVRLSHRTLERYRVTGEGPEFFKLGRLVFYETPKLDEWLERKRRRSTSDPGRDPTEH